MLSNLGYKTGFIGKVGNDGFGKLLKETLDKENISTDGLVLSDEYNTTAAFVHLDENGDEVSLFIGILEQTKCYKKMKLMKRWLKIVRFFILGLYQWTNEPVKSSNKKGYRILQKKICINIIWSKL